MQQGNAIEVKNITKKFKVYYDKGSQLKERLLFKNRNRYEERKVLNDISFDVKKGEAIGLIGHNGCGKSTTLKLLTRIIYPDSGSIEMTGRVSSLIELGAGFHPDMSGRENIYTNAAIFGLTKKEINSRIDDIIAFSELEEFIDNPVRTYSSGMYMRLAFSVAINVDADILMIDEILAVGDAAFQAKCFNRLRKIKAEGTTIVIVSHSLGQIEQICDRSIWIHNGEIREEGEPRRVHMDYMDYMGQKQQEVAERERARQEEKNKIEEQMQAVPNESESPAAKQDTSAEKEILNDEAAEPVNQTDDAGQTEKESKKRWGNKKAQIERVSMLDKDGNEKMVFATGEKVQIRVDYKVNEKVVNAVFGIGIFRIDGVQCYGTNTRVDKLDEYDLENGGTTICDISQLNLIAGKYTLDVAIECDNGIPVDYFREVCTFEMYSPIPDVGVARMNHEWVFKKKVY